MKIDRPRLRNALKKKGFNQVHIDEIDECVRIKQLLDKFKEEKGLPDDEAWKNYEKGLKL